MWRRLISSDLQTLATRSLRRVSLDHSAPRFHSTTPFKRTSPLFSPAAASVSGILLFLLDLSIYFIFM